MDKTDKTEGEAALSLSVGGGAVNDMPLDPAIDGTGYDTLEFDFYISDMKLFDHFTGEGMNSGLEITSAGRCDHQEISWKLHEIRNCTEGEPLKQGWNHVILPLDSGVVDGGKDVAELVGAFDISNINYMRFFMVGEPQDIGVVVKLDNIRLSNYDAVTTAQKQAEQNQKKAEQFADEVNSIPAVTEDNFTEIRATLDALNKEYEKLKDGAKDKIPVSVMNRFKEIEAAVAALETAPPATDDAEPSTEDNEPTDDENDDEKNGDRGCAGVIGGGSIVMMVFLSGLGVVALKKRR